MNASSWPALSTLVILALLGTGCALADQGDDAEDLTSSVAEMSAVTAADMHYAEPTLIDSGKLRLKVRMEPDATVEEIAAVVEEVYSAFRGTHRQEEADLTIRAGDTRLSLRSFDPEAEVEPVVEAARTGLTAAPAGGSAVLDLTTDDVVRGDHVAGTYRIFLPDGSTHADIPRALTALAAENSDDPLFGWGVVAADGSGLSYDDGFPPADLVRRWEGLQEAGPRLKLWTYEDGPLVARARLDSAATPVPQIRAQLAALGPGQWTYELIAPRGRRIVSIDRDRFCLPPTSDGALDDRLEAWAEARFGPCQES